MSCTYGGAKILSMSNVYTHLSVQIHCDMSVFFDSDALSLLGCECESARKVGVNK